LYAAHYGSDDGLRRQNGSANLLKDDSDYEEDDYSFLIDATEIEIGGDDGDDNEELLEVRLKSDDVHVRPSPLKPSTSTKVARDEASTTAVPEQLEPAPAPRSKLATTAEPKRVELSITPIPEDDVTFPIQPSTTTTTKHKKTHVELPPVLSRMAMTRGGTPSAKTPTANQFARNRTVESFQSLESIDSLAESYWDPEDDTTTSHIMTNLAPSSAFFNEHVHFLREQTQPRKVEVVWNGTNEHPENHTGTTTGDRANS